MKYLITGGAGFIGSHLADALIARGDSVAVLDNLSTGNLKNVAHLESINNFTLINGSILDEALVEKAVKNVDHILHLAASVGVFNIVKKPLESLITNINGTEIILKVASKYSKPVLIASSSEVYGKNSNMPLDEESDRVIGSPLKSRWSYSEAKAIDESMGYFYFLENKLEIRIMRLFNTVGPRQSGDYGMVLPRFMKSALLGDDLVIYGNGEQTRSFCHVDDVVKAICLLVNSLEAIGQAINIGNNQEITINNLAKKVIEITESKSRIVHLDYEQAYNDGYEDLNRRIPNISKAKKYLNWKPINSIDQIIKDTERFYR